MLHLAALCLMLVTEPIKLTDGMGMSDRIATGLASQLPETARWPITGTLTLEDGTPADATFNIIWAGGSKQVSPDADGTFRTLIPPTALTTATIEPPPGHLVSLDPFKGGTMQISTSPDAAPARDIDADDLDAVSAGTTEVLSENLPQTQAIAALAELERIRGYVDAAIGVDLGTQPFGIALLETEAASIAFPGRVLIPVKAEAWFSPNAGPRPSNARWVVTHEWTETALNRAGLRYRDEPRLRLLGDGIAELASFAYTTRYQPEFAIARLEQYARSIGELRRDGTELYDPSTMFLGRSASTAGAASRGRIGSTAQEAAGYAVAFWVMHQAHLQAGPEGVRRMIGLMQEGERSADVLAKAAGVSSTTPLSLADIERGIKSLAETIAQDRDEPADAP